MRTITLKEWTPQTQYLTTDELASLRAASRYVSVQLDPDVPDAYRLVPNSRVGTLVFDQLRILIRPKVNLPNVFFLLGYGAGLPEWTTSHFPFDLEGDLLRAVSWMFEAEVASAIPRGLARGYVDRQDALLTLRGRIDFTRQISARAGLPIPLECNFQEYSDDVSLNRKLKAAHVQLLRLAGLDDAVAKRLRAWLRAFVDVEDESFDRPFPDHEFDRLTAHWERAGRLAELILRRETLVDREGSTYGRAFTVDMNKLFERFIERVVEERAQQARVQLIPQARRQLSRSAWMKPDLVISRRGVDGAVGDVKYKRLDIEDMPHADLYQLLAYCTSMGLPRGILIYATHEAPRVEVVHRAGIELEITGVDLAQAPRDMLAQARSVADRLIDQALVRGVDAA